MTDGPQANPLTLRLVGGLFDLIAVLVFFSVVVVDGEALGSEFFVEENSIKP